MASYDTSPLIVYNNLAYKQYMSTLSEKQQKDIEDKRDYYFARLGLKIYKLIQMDEEAAYSVTEVALADETSLYIMEKISGEKSPTITDATACIGGNTFSFSRYFEHVNAVEINPMRAEFLRQNVKIVCENKNNVTVHQGDFTFPNLQQTLKQDVVFFDPPWGGPEYWKEQKMSLFLSEQPLVEVCRGLRGCTSVIVIKVPYNFDFETFQKKGSVDGVLYNFDTKEVGMARKRGSSNDTKEVGMARKRGSSKWGADTQVTRPKFVLLSMNVL